MSIREIGIICLMAFVVLLCNLAAAGIERSNWEEAQEPLLGYLVDSGGINQEMAEFLWLNCRIELIHAKKALEDLESHSPEDRSSDSEKLSEDRLSGEEDTHKTADCLHPLVQKILLDCLKERNMMLPICGEEKGFKSWYTRYLGFLFARPSSSSRRELIQRIEGEPPSAPTVSPPTQATSVPTSTAPFPASPPYLPFFLHNLNNSSLQIKTIKYTSKKSSSSKKKSGKKDGGNTAVIAAVAIAAVALACVLLCLLCCCMCCCKSSNRRGRKDEKPLLCLSLSDHSLASSRKSLDLGTSMYDEHKGNQFLSGSLNQSKTSGKFYTDPQAVTDSEVKIPVGDSAGTGINSNSIPKPPGMVGKPSCPPLKPPPGRAIPPKPHVANTALPPPSPPVPPPAPPLKPKANGPRPPPPPGAPPPPPPSGMKTGPRPPPPPGGVPPPRPPAVGLKGPRRAPAAPNNESTSSEYGGGSNKTKLKPFFWDKVNAKPDNAMVWDQLKAGSFQFNEEMIENLFGYAPTVKNQKEGKKGSVQDAPQYIQIIDQKKSQNLSILLKALNVTTEEVSDALQEGNELPAELIQTLLKMAPTSEEELKLRLYSGELSRLGPADRFLKILVEIPFAFKRLETLHLMCTLEEEAAGIKESFKVLEVACTELRKSRLFLKLLEAVLKTGNRMNDGTFRGGAQAFKLDTLLKLSDVKGIDGKTTLLHFVVQEIIRSEGIRAARAARESQSFSSIKTEDLTMEDSSQESDEQMRSLGLQVVSGLANQLENVKKAAGLDADGLTSTVCRVGNGFVNSRNFLNTEMKDIDEDNGFLQALKSFVENAEAEVMFLLEEEKRIMSLVKSTADYFHGTAGKDEGLRLFVIVRDFLIILDKVCKEVKNIPRKPAKKEEPPAETPAPAPPRKSVAEDTHQRLSSAISNKRHDSSSSDDD